MSAESGKIVGSEPGYSADLVVWGAQYGNRDLTTQGKNLFQGLDVGHSAVQFTFPINDKNIAMVERMATQYGEDFGKLFQRNDDSGTFDFYWSFWPDEEGKNPHVLATLKEDIYWQRFGVPFDYDVSSTSNTLGKELGETASRRNARGLLGQRKPYKLGPELITQYPNGFAFEKLFSLEPALLEQPEKGNEKRTLTQAQIKSISDLAKENLEFLKLEKRKDALTEEEAIKHQDLLEKYGSKAQALGNILYFHQVLHMNAIELNNINFKESRKYSKKDMRNPDKQSDIEASVEIINKNITLIEDSKKAVSEIEQAIPEDLMRYTTHGLQPERISFPVFSNDAANKESAGLNLEQALHAAGKMSKARVPYKLTGAWNCSSTAANIIHQGLQNCHEIKKKFSLNRILPYTPQQFYNRALSGQKKLHNSTLHGERSQSFIQWAKSIRDSIVRKIKSTIKSKSKDDSELSVLLQDPILNGAAIKAKIEDGLRRPDTEEAVALLAELKRALKAPDYFKSHKPSQGIFFSRGAISSDLAAQRKKRALIKLCNEVVQAHTPTPSQNSIRRTV